MPIVPALASIFVLAHAGADRLELVLVSLLERSHARVRFAWRGHDQLAERIARAGGRRRPIDPDRNRRQAAVDVLPGLGPVQLAERRLGNREVDVALGDVGKRALLGGRQRDAVEADLDFGDRSDAVRGAQLGFGCLHAA